MTRAEKRYNKWLNKTHLFHTGKDFISLTNLNALANSGLVEPITTPTDGNPIKPDSANLASYGIKTGHSNDKEKAEKEGNGDKPEAGDLAADKGGDRQGLHSKKEESIQGGHGALHNGSEKMDAGQSSDKSEKQLDSENPESIAVS